MPIVLQQQPTSESCLPTCVAMSMGLKVEDLGVPLDRGHAPYEFGVWYAERGVWLRKLPITDGFAEPFIPGYLYLLEVRSLNDVGIDHAILLDMRDGTSRIFDPNTGRPGKRRYESITTEDTITANALVVRGPTTAGFPPRTGPHRPSDLPGYYTKV